MPSISTNTDSWNITAGTRHASCKEVRLSITVTLYDVHYYHWQYACNAQADNFQTTIPTRFILKSICFTVTAKQHVWATHQYTVNRHSERQAIWQCELASRKFYNKVFYQMPTKYPQILAVCEPILQLLVRWLVCRLSGDCLPHLSWTTPYATQDEGGLGWEWEWYEWCLLVLKRWCFARRILL